METKTVPAGSPGYVLKDDHPPLRVPGLGKGPHLGHEAPVLGHVLSLPAALNTGLDWDTESVLACWAVSECRRPGSLLGPCARRSSKGNRDSVITFEIFLRCGFLSATVLPPSLLPSCLSSPSTSLLSSS